jgi:uncharacterized Ntn-hydrolase superfamily protein
VFFAEIIKCVQHMSKHLSTFSIVGCDLEERTWGVAVASKFLAVGSVVSWAQAGTGAVATQALARVSFGFDGLKLMAEGKSAQETLDALLAADDRPEHRQAGFIDAAGQAAAHTGTECLEWAGHKTGQFYTCQGNLLTGPETINAMSEAFTSARGSLASRLMAALTAGDSVGGDRRGKQSAALLVVRPGGGYGGDNDRYIDLRVDDDPEPVKKLRRLLGVHQLFFGQSNPEDKVDITPEIATELQVILHKQGYFAGEPNGEWDDMSKLAFWSLIGNENLEERWNLDGNTDVIDRVALDYLRERFR